MCSFGKNISIFKWLLHNELKYTPSKEIDIIMLVELYDSRKALAIEEKLYGQIVIFTGNKKNLS